MQFHLDQFMIRENFNFSKNFEKYEFILNYQNQKYLNLQRREKKKMNNNIIDYFLIIFNCL